MKNRLPPDATLVIPQRNHVELTAACVASIRQTDRVAWPILVVDDASDPAPGGMGSLPALASVCLLRHERQCGVTAAWNTGARAVQSPFVVWLNNDCLAKGPWVDGLLAPLRAGSFDLVGVAWRIERAVDPRLLKPFGGPRFLQGWCFAARTKTWETLNGFDEAMAFYWSDTDFFVRARQRGMRLGVVEGLPLVHLGHRTAHDPSCLPDRHTGWQRDRRVFVQKIKVPNSIRAGSASDRMSMKRTTGGRGNGQHRKSARWRSRLGVGGSVAMTPRPALAGARG